MRVIVADVWHRMNGGLFRTFLRIAIESTFPKERAKINFRL